MKTLKEFFTFDNKKNLVKIQIYLSILGIIGLILFNVMLSSSSIRIIFASDYPLMVTAISVLLIGVAQVRIENLEL